MEKLCKELDDAKATIEKLVAENRTKSELCESLRRGHNEQTVKLKEAKSVIEKQEQQLNAKAEEISATKHMYDDVKVKLHGKESALRHLSIANDKLRSDSSEKVQKLGEQNRELVFALDEANARAADQDMRINKLKEEIGQLKGVVFVTQKKCSEAEEKAKAVKELRHRDDIVMKAKEEYSKIQDQLKWKKEQFKHLEEAHQKMQDQFSSSKKEWEREKSKLFDEICALQTSLDSQTRITENLQSQLQMCNQALAHEESRRKLLEVEVSESKMSYENVYSEYQEAKTKIESLTGRRDEDIAELRNLLSRKDSLYKEAEFRREHLELENQDLRKSLKEFQEAQIQEAGTASSLSKLRSKLRGLEQVHKECSAILKAREAEQASQLDNLASDLDECRSELDRKDEHIQQLQMELDECDASIMQLEIEILEKELMVIVFKDAVSDAQWKWLPNSEVELELGNEDEAELEFREKEDGEQIGLLMEQLEEKNNDLVRSYDMIEQERNVAASLMTKIESLDSIEQMFFPMQKELERYKELLEESNVQKVYLREQNLQIEKALKEDLQKVSDDLDNMNSELAQKANEVSELEFELDTWKSVAENLQSYLDESLEFRREMEASLLAQVETEQILKQEKESLLCIVEEKEKCACDLKQQIVLLEQEVVRSDTGKSAREGMEKEHWLRIVEEREKSIDNLKHSIDQLYLEITKREFETAILEKIEAEVIVQKKNERLLRDVEGKEKIIEDFRSQIYTIHETWQKITKAVVFGEIEIQEKKLVVFELEEEMTSLLQKLELQEKSFSHLKQQGDHLQAELEAKLLETEKEVDQLQSRLSTSEGLVKDLESQKGILLQDILKMSSERGNLLVLIEGLYEQICDFSTKDIELTGRVERLVQSFDCNSGDLRRSKEFYDADGENFRPPLSASLKNVDTQRDERLPLKPRND